MYRIGQNIPTFEAQYRGTIAGAIKLAGELALKLNMRVEVDRKVEGEWYFIAVVK